MQASVKNGTVTVEGVVAGALDTSGNFFALDSLPKHHNYVGNQLTYTDATDGASTWRYTYTYDVTTGNLTDESGWVKQ